jgi:hypothetical protein
MSYTLSVFLMGETMPVETVLANRAPDAMKKIQELLLNHEDCERIRIYSISGFLFSVDCRGERIDD